MNILIQNMTPRQKLGFFVRLGLIKARRWPVADRRLAAFSLILGALVLLTGCDPALVGTTPPDQLRNVACVLDSLPDGVAALDDAEADAKAQAAKIIAGEKILATDVDGTTALVNVATEIRVCLEAKPE